MIRIHPASTVLRIAAAAAFAAVLLVPLASQQPPPSGSAIFWNVSIVDLDAGATVPGMAVEVAGGRIVRVEPARGTPPTDLQVIDGQARFLLPGLWDSHVHLTKVGEPSLAMFLAHGVTSVRDMGSDLAEVQAWRAAIASGSRAGPRIKTSGPILESRANVERMKREKTVEPVDRLRVPVGTPDEARAAVAKLAGAGADFLKVRTVANPETFKALVAAARERNLKLTGHPQARVDDVIDARMASIEHMLTLPPLDLPPDRRRWVFLSYEAAQAAMKKDPRRRFVTTYLASDWAEQLEEKRPADAAREIQTFVKMAPLFFRDLREMHAAGVTFVAGSDTGVGMIHPGWSLHGELESLVQNVGLTPAEALRTATINPAAFFGLDKELGAIKPGYRADLLLVAGDPLRDVRRTMQIAGVMQDGRWLDRKTLAALLESAARAARGR
jgi:imidazolonepropionase-like amidohydrolase